MSAIETIEEAIADGTATARRFHENRWTHMPGGPYHETDRGLDPMRSGRAQHEAWMRAFREERDRLASGAIV